MNFLVINGTRHWLSIPSIFMKNIKVKGRQCPDCKTDIFLISKAKLDSFFPAGQFIMKGYRKPFRLDRNQIEGDLLLCVREEIPCNILNEYSSEKPIENIEKPYGVHIKKIQI